MLATPQNFSIPGFPTDHSEPYVNVIQTPSDSGVWSTLPKNISPTCPLDHVLIDLVRCRRAYEPTGGNVQEFQKRAFPSVQSLLNPTDEAKKTPVTNIIVRDIIRVMTVPTLPEQIAILHVMSSVVRWQISPTESNYDSMPEWLRPMPSQLTTSHPAWADTFPWPKARERLCRYQQYHDQLPTISDICNESISINWPYEASDMIIQMNGADTILNPIFERHIKTLSNWTLGKRFLDV
jgi:hypothetical protein